MSRQWLAFAREPPRRLKLRPLAVGVRRLDRRLDESEALDAVVDAGKCAPLRRLLALARGFDGERYFAVDVGEAFEVALGVAGGTRVTRAAASPDLGRRGSGCGSACHRANRASRSARPAPIAGALGPVDAQLQAVLVARRHLAHPDRAARAVGVTQHDLRVVVERAALAERSQSAESSTRSTPQT